MLTKEQIINYLESRGIKDKFEANHKTNMSRMNGWPEEKYSLDNYIDKFKEMVESRYTEMSKFISGGFPWISSKEGYYF